MLRISWDSTKLTIILINLIVLRSQGMIVESQAKLLQSIVYDWQIHQVEAEKVFLNVDIEQVVAFQIEEKGVVCLYN